MSRAETALVAGINGFVGAALARCLRAHGWRVVGLLRAGRSWDRLVEIAGLELIEIEAYSPEALRRGLRRVQADVVFNTAAAGIMTKVTDPVELLRGNGLVASNLLQAIAGGKVRRFLQLGSYSEYAPGKAGVLMDESWPAEPSSDYGIAKLTTTHMARMHAQRLGIPLTVLRLFGVYGSGEAPHRLLPALLRRLQEREAMDLTPGLQQRDWLHVEDAAAALEQAARTEDLGPSGSVYNICTSEAASVRAVGEWARELAGAPAHLLRWGALPARPDEPMWAVGDPRHFQATTGWQARWTWREGVRAMMQPGKMFLAA
jgi:nucleoside-diphosphate-sugar epimerase